MRILLVLDRVENPASANAQLACRLAEQLLAQGHEIHLSNTNKIRITVDL